MIYPYGYPLPDDADEATQALVADVAADPYLTVLCRPLHALDERISILFAGLSDLTHASGATLDIAGDIEGEARGGLSDDEYRRLIAGRRVARAGGVTPAAVLRGWVALTEALDAELTEPGASSVHLIARVSYAPSSIWLRRARAVVRDLVGAGYDVSALVYRADTARYDTPPGYDLGTYAWSL